MSQNTQVWLLVVGSPILLNGLLLYFLYFRRRGWDRKARVERRLLVKEDEQCVWRTVKGRLLVGWSDSKGEVTSGSYGRLDDYDSKQWDGDWAVIESKQKFVVYRFHRRVDDEPKTGMIQVCNSWRELEAALPAKIFEEALRNAGIKKPNEYRVSPLEL